MGPPASVVNAVASIATYLHLRGIREWIFDMAAEAVRSTPALFFNHSESLAPRCCALPRLQAVNIFFVYSSILGVYDSG